MLFVVADLHVRAGSDSEEKFRSLLAWLSSTSYDVAFLGDVLELWIALPGYEDALAGEFLEWCRREKKRRRIYFIEGNHEFFVARMHRDAFTEASEDVLELFNGALLLLHGDGIPGGVGFGHRFFRALVKGWLCRFLLRFLPGAHGVVRCIKHRFEKAGLKRLYRSPEGALRRWAEQRHSAVGCRRIILGHYHHGLDVPLADGRILTVLPAWKDRQEIGLLDISENQLIFLNP